MIRNDYGMIERLTDSEVHFSKYFFPLCKSRKISENVTVTIGILVRVYIYVGIGIL